MYYEQRYLDRQDEGGHVDPPYILTISKGTQIPSHFILSKRHSDCFCLEPSHGMTLDVRWTSSTINTRWKRMHGTSSTSIRIGTT
ncbi:uncharacterized protein B0H64DRAFT_405823 [Chaetomium fimeti]|uniref:Tse2 ADP-ribosyltransferase toxin domain-containing protein n=1 Tax=Chaetomium fimeti TaxID=1854472 RepID=A0AAE0HAV2_9PEZI|nr:hypothetical protein B0H64DRAFT_405823 [Chaetomium fimeti]